MKKITILLVFLITINIIAQNTYVPDDNFEQALIDLGYDTVLDNYVPTANISTVTFLEVYEKNIVDLTGIEDFNNLQHLDCYNNQLTSIDVSQNTALTLLYCASNLLTSLDVSQNTALTELNCWGNQLTSLDISQNTALQLFVCFSNQLNSLDVSQNIALTDLYCSNNQLISLDISQNTALTKFWCSTNQLSSLDISQHTVLTDLVCSDNQLSNLDTSQNIALAKLWISDNQLVNLDLNQNTMLTELYCWNNQLTSLDVKNGNNTNFTDFYAQNNPSLTCIEVDDAVWSTANWTNIDATASFSEDCGTASINDLNNQLEKLQITNYQEEEIKVKTSNSSIIKQFAVNNILGKLLVEATPNQPEFIIQNANLKKGTVLFIKAQLENGQVLNTKFLKY